MGSLSLATCHFRGQTSLTNPEQTSALQLTPLEQLLKIVHYLPISWRKWLLDLSRIQGDPMTNSALLTAYNELFPVSIVIAAPREAPYEITMNELRSLTVNFYDSDIACTILSYFVRSESTARLEEFLEVHDETVTKETKAALFYIPHESQLHYNALFGDGSQCLSQQTDAAGKTRVALLLERNLEQFRAMHSRQQAPIFLPIFNDKKSVSSESQELLFREVFGDMWEHMLENKQQQITTLSLLKHYHETGNQIMGAVEVRVAWKYGDLKPRVYYCNGGESYWCSLWVKPMVNHLLTALPSTNPHSRYEVQRLGQLGSDKILVTYDYTSFTTSLSELKFFLHNLAESLIGTSVSCLDVRYGVIDVDVGEYLHTYNQVVNLHQEIDLRRVLPRNSGKAIFRQGRNGSLGVQGNIGFSTILHGIVLGDFSQTPDRDSVVGDDALTIIFEILLRRFIEHTNVLGTIHPEKYTTFHRPPEDHAGLSEEEKFKYLKRPISVDFMGNIRTGTLDFFPSVADFLFPEGDEIHNSSMSSDPIVRVQSLCTQWGRYLNLTHQSESLDRTHDTDLEFILDIMGMCYDKVGLPREGGIPGAVFYPNGRGEAVTADFFIPPCDSVSVFETDWVEVLYAHHAGVRIVSPVRIGGTVLLDPYAQSGTRMRVTDGDNLVRLLEGLGYLRKSVVLEELPFDNAYTKRLNDIFAGRGGELLYEVQVLKELPDWYFPVASQRLYSLEPIDIGRKLEEIRSVTGTSVF